MIKIAYFVYSRLPVKARGLIARYLGKRWIGDGWSIRPGRENDGAYRWNALNYKDFDGWYIYSHDGKRGHRGNS